MASTPKKKSIKSQKSEINSMFKAAKLLTNTPAEYQASVYAKLEKERYKKSNDRKRKEINILKSELSNLKEKLKKTLSMSERDLIKKEITNLEATIKKSPRPKRKWSPILSGSFESGKK